MKQLFFVNVRNYLKRFKFLRTIKRALCNITPKRIRFQFNLLKIKLFDKLYKTDFGGRLYQDEIGISRERANDYSPSPVDLIKTLKKLDISNKDTIVDMGSGKGYAMYLMSKYPFAFVGGWNYLNNYVLWQGKI